jgi:hypothetical protein
MVRLLFMAHFLHTLRTDTLLPCGGSEWSAHIIIPITPTTIHILINIFNSLFALCFSIAQLSVFAILSNNENYNLWEHGVLR